MPDSRQDALVNNFRRLLNSLTCKVKMVILKVERKVRVFDQEVPTEYYRFFVESYGSPLDHFFDRLGYKYQRVTEVPSVQPVKIFRKHIALPGGRLMRTYTVYRLPGSLVEGFISETYGVADRITITVEPLPPDLAASKMSRYLRVLRGILLAEQSKGRSPSEELRMRHDMAAATYQALVSGATRLFKVKVNISVVGGGLKELNEKANWLKQILQGRMVRVDSPMFMQYGLALGEEGKTLIMDSETLGAFFPFVSADLIEAPGGIFLGVNRDTGAPVIFDPWLRMNQNILIVGKPGSGKSFTTKLMLTRLAAKMRDLAFYIVDSENEYGYLGRLLGAEVVDVRRGKPLGLDPVRLFGSSKDTAANILADLARINDGKLRSHLRTVVGKSDDIFDVYHHADSELKDYLEPLIDGPDSFLVTGEPLNFTGRMVFNLKSLHSEFKTSREESTTLHAASVLIFSKIWNVLDNPSFLPIQTPKFVAVDEVWLYTSMPASAGFLETVSRRGRKRNISFILCTQRASDVLEGISGRALVENCASKILLRQDEAAINLVSEVFGLSEAEKDELLDFKEGQAILIAENVHIPVDFLATKEEYSVFTTKPAERIIS